MWYKVPNNKNNASRKGNLVDTQNIIESTKITLIEFYHEVPNYPHHIYYLRVNEKVKLNNYELS